MTQSETADRYIYPQTEDTVTDTCGGLGVVFTKSRFNIITLKS